MPITATEIQYMHSGGAANADPNASLGGVISTTEITDATLHNLFDLVSGDESSAGDVEYRCFYLKNNHGSLEWQNVSVWVETDNSGVDTEIAIGLGTAAIGGTEQTVADESTAPAGVTFDTALGEANELVIGNIPAGSHKAVWVRRTVSAAASAASNLNVTIRANGDTAA